MLDPALDVGNAPAGVALVPGAIEFFGGGPELHDQVAGQVLRRGLAAFLLPEANQGSFIAPHNDPSVRAADEGAANHAMVYVLAKLHCNLLARTLLSDHASEKHGLVPEFMSQFG